MATQLFKNNANSTLAASLASGVTTLSVQTGHGARFPAITGSDYFYVTLQDSTNIEIVKVTARSSDSMTIVRAQEGTTSPASFASGTIVALRLTAAAIETVVNHANDTSAAHAASAISYAGSAGLVATDVEAALDELDTDKEAAGTAAAAIDTHVGLADPHTQYALDTDLTSGLAGKANTTHSHAAGDITSGSLAIASGGTGAATAVDAFTALKQAATETATGVVEKATSAEMTAGTADKYPDAALVKTATDAAAATAKVSSNDTTPGYLNGKLVAGTNITLTEGSDGANETLTIASSGISPDVGAGGVGMMAEMLNGSGSPVNSGATIAGSGLKYMRNGADSGVVAAGTWRNISGSAISSGETSAFQRIS